MNDHVETVHPLLIKDKEHHEQVLAKGNGVQPSIKEAFLVKRRKDFNLEESKYRFPNLDLLLTQ